MDLNKYNMEKKNNLFLKYNLKYTKINNKYIW